MYNGPVIPKLGLAYIFPDPKEAMSAGLLAYGGDLKPRRVIEAYKKGIFPWYNRGDPILWWSPDPRLILYPKEFKISRSLRKKLRQKRFLVKLDKNFEAVIKNCSIAPRAGQDGSWILPEIIDSFTLLHKMGFAHSVEVYSKDSNELVGGLYGISIGAAFFGESMFSLVSDASKIALAYLVELMKIWGFYFIDCQVSSNHLMSLGAIKVDRNRFLNELEVSQSLPGVYGRWSRYEWLINNIEWRVQA